MPWTAHGEQCRMAEVPPNRTHCYVTGNISTSFTAVVGSCNVICVSHKHSMEFHHPNSAPRSCRTQRALWCGPPATGWPRSCWSWTRRALWTPSTLPSWVWLSSWLNSCRRVSPSDSTSVTRQRFCATCLYLWAAHSVLWRWVLHSLTHVLSSFQWLTQTILSLFWPHFIQY